jgi:hypothetical protein
MQRVTMGILTGVCLLAAQRAEAAPTVTELARAKLAAARTTYEATVAAYQAGHTDADAAYRWSCRWLEAERDVSDKKADRVAALEAHRDRMKALREIALARYKAGQASQADALGAGFYVAEAELWLARAKAP